MNRSDLAVENLRGKMVAAITRKIGVNESIATPIAEAVLDALRDEFAGRALYIPARSKAARNAAVLAEFNGRNHAEVCKKHDISRRTLYELIGRRRAGG